MCVCVWGGGGGGGGGAFELMSGGNNFGAHTLQKYSIK